MSFPRENMRSTATLDDINVVYFVNTLQNILLGKESGIQ